MYNLNKPLSHYEKICAGRGLAIKKLPYFSNMIFALMPKPIPGMMKKVGAAMGVTKTGILYYDPDVIEKDWDLKDVEFGLVHEACHIMRKHGEMREEYGYDPQIWNEACDCAINDGLIAAGLKSLPTDCMPNKVINPATKKPMQDGLPEQAYYDAIRIDRMNNPPPPNQQGQEPGQASGIGRPGAGKCGGGAGNPFDELEQDGGEADGTGEGEGRSDADLERARNETADQMQKHMEQKGRGSIPGGWAVWADNQLKPPKIRWQDKINHAIRQSTSKIAGMVDFHYARPSRRQGALGYGPGKPILPSMYAPKPKIGCFVDTSGSMGPNDLELAMSEIDGVLKQTHAEVMFGACDSQMHGKIETVKNVREACQKLQGGGGTNFIPVFEELQKLPKSERPNLVIFATDGDGPAPAVAPPGMEVIWVLVGNHAVMPYSGGYGGERINYGAAIWVTDDGMKVER